MDKPQYYVCAEDLGVARLEHDVVASRIDKFGANNTQELENLAAYLLHFYKKLFIYQLYRGNHINTCYLLEERIQKEPGRKSEQDAADCNTEVDESRLTDYLWTHAANYSFPYPI